MEKRGAIELSITTIVVVVIGITLLTLGLIWVSGIFGKLEGTTQGAFEKVDTQIDEIIGGGTGKGISVTPSSLTLKRGETAKAKVILAHIDTIDTADKTVKAEMIRSSDPELKCIFADSGGTISNPYTLKSGFQAEITVLISDIGADLGGGKVCNFKVSGFGTVGDFEESIIVELIR